MITKILVAYDGSPPADKAFDLACDLAARYGARLWVLAVARPPEPPTVVEGRAVLEQAEEHFEERFAALRQRAGALASPPSFEVVVGHPAAYIVDYAFQLGADLIVIGHRGKSLLQRLLLGSVSKQVIQLAHCPVLVVR